MIIVEQQSKSPIYANKRNLSCFIIMAYWLRRFLGERLNLVLQLVPHVSTSCFRPAFNTVLLALPRRIQDDDLLGTKVMLACGAAHYLLSCGCVVHVHLSCLCEAEILLRLTLGWLFLSLTRVAVTTMRRIFISSGNCVLSSRVFVDCELTDVISYTSVLSS